MNNIDLKIKDEFIGAMIQQSRKRKGLTQEQLAAAVGISTMSIRRYESGARIVPEKTLKKISDILGDIEIDGDWKEAFLRFYVSRLEKICNDEKNKLEKTRFETELIEQEMRLLAGEALWNLTEVRKMNIEEFINSANGVLLMSFYEKLNVEGQDEAVKRVEELTLIPKYQRSEEPTDDTEYTDTTKQEKPPESLIKPTDGNK